MSAQEHNEPKINLGEFLLVLPFLAILDIFQILLTFVDAAFGLGEVIKELLAIFTTLPLSILFQFYLIMKGIRGTWYTLTFIGDMVPVVNTLPMMTIAWIALFIVDRIPVAKQALAMASKATPAKGGAPAIAGGH